MLDDFVQFLASGKKCCFVVSLSNYIFGNCQVAWLVEILLQTQLPIGSPDALGRR